MQIKTNVRAGSQTQKRSSSTDSTSTDTSSSQASGTTGFYIPPTSRCVGI